ncbi:hypothetical protein MBRA_01382 [Methylobacterium brachiatum]|nr:hypothetical protein MBRA_01382 [Methylobacterium brachiatum]
MGSARATAKHLWSLAFPRVSMVAVASGVVPRRADKTVSGIGYMSRFVQGDDAPLSYVWRADRAAMEMLGMQPGRTTADRAVRASVIAAAMIEHDGQGRRISYSRNRNFYAEARYEGSPMSYARLVTFVDALDVAGHIHHFKAEQGAHLAPDERDRLQSAFWATEQMAETLRGIKLAHVGPTSPIILNDLDDRPMALPRTDRVLRLRRGVDEVNAGLTGIRLTVDPAADPANWRRSDYHLRARKVRADGSETWACMLPTPTPFVVRIFSRGTFDLHGRYYGYWQQLPKARRSEMLINNELIVEPDFHWLHPTLLYAMCGHALAHDPYTTGYWPRPAGKLAFNTYVNAPTTASAIGGLMKKAKEKDDNGEPVWRYGYRQTARILDAIKEANPRVAHLFGSDAGVRLMAIDSNMAGAVMKACRRAFVPCLPVHDSFMVPASKGGFVEGVMASVLDETLAAVKSTSSGTSTRTVLQSAPSLAGVPPEEPVEAFKAEPVGSSLPVGRDASLGSVGASPAEPVVIPLPATWGAFLGPVGAFSLEPAARLSPEVMGVFPEPLGAFLAEPVVAFLPELREPSLETSRSSLAAPVVSPSPEVRRPSSGTAGAPLVETLGSFRPIVPLLPARGPSGPLSPHPGRRPPFPAFLAALRSVPSAAYRPSGLASLARSLPPADVGP